MNGNSGESAVVTQLLADLECWNAPQVRGTAITRLGGLGQAARPAVNALSKIATQQSGLSHLARVALDKILMSTPGHDAGRRAIQTTVKIETDTAPGLDVAGGKTYCRCNFCSKESLMTPANRRLTEKLSGRDRYYCTFCLRHRLNQRDSRHTLVLSFRGIIGYYYYAFHAMQKTPQMALSEIWDYVNLHVQVGQQNPLFIYDPETFLWFIDFTRVGATTRKMPIKDVLGTVGEIVLSFGLHENVKDIKPHKMYLKYEEAIHKFYHQRSRPANMRVLSPTLKLTGAAEYAPEKLARYDHTTTTVVAGNEKKRIPVDETRNFLPTVLHEALGKKY